MNKTGKVWQVCAAAILAIGIFALSQAQLPPILFYPGPDTTIATTKDGIPTGDTIAVVTEIDGAKAIYVKATDYPRGIYFSPAVDSTGYKFLWRLVDSLKTGRITEVSNITLDNTSHQTPFVSAVSAKVNYDQAYFEYMVSTTGGNDHTMIIPKGYYQNSPMNFITEIFEFAPTVNPLPGFISLSMMPFLKDTISILAPVEIDLAIEKEYYNGGLLEISSNYKHTYKTELKSDTIILYADGSPRPSLHISKIATPELFNKIAILPNIESNFIKFKAGLTSGESAMEYAIPENGEVIDLRLSTDTSIAVISPVNKATPNDINPPKVYGNTVYFDANDLNMTNFSDITVYDLQGKSFDVPAACGLRNYSLLLETSGVFIVSVVGKNCSDGQVINLRFVFRNN